MSEYKEAKFNFITKSENFKAAFEVSEQMEEIKKKLITDFWKAVKIKIESKIEEKKLEWTIRLDDVFDTYSKLHIFTSGSYDISASYEGLSKNLLFGIWIHTQNGNFDQKDIDENIKKKNLFMDKNLNSKHWICWENYQDHFNKIETLMKILIDIREKFADEIATHLFKFAEENKVHIDEFCKMRIQ